jgi:hypothetical protein
MHEKEIVGAAIGLFFGPEKPQAFFKLREKGVRFFKMEDLPFFLGHEDGPFRE